MEEDKKALWKLTEGKKLRKDQYLLMILVGILLCIIVIPTGKKDTKSGLSNTKGATMEEPADLAAADTQPDYVGYWEDKLENALRYVDGVGKVKVLITLRSSEQKIVEKDGPEESSDTDETDAAGGSRRITESRAEKSTVYTADGRGGDIPYVVMTIPPAVEGVVVIAQMTDRENLQENIIEAIQVLFDMDVNKIKIVKMKNNK